MLTAFCECFWLTDQFFDLTHAVAEALHPCKFDESAIHWVSPLAADNYSEYRDKEFLGFIGAGHLAPKLREFWPRGGPCWDALARLDGGGCVLVEAKSHVPELYGNGCGAVGESLSLIQSSLARTKAMLGVSPDADWLGRLYQSANRLAYLYFLREIGKVDAFLASVYFTGDPHSHTTRQEWDEAIRTVNEELGIASPVPYSVSVFLGAVGSAVPVAHGSDSRPCRRERVCRSSAALKPEHGDFVIVTALPRNPHERLYSQLDPDTI
jgi:hypothetical protein